MPPNANNTRLHAALPLFVPDTGTLARSQLTSFIHYCEVCIGRTFDEYAHFDRFSAEDFRTFWRLFVCWSKVLQDGDIDPVCLGDVCEGARFFPNLRLNYAENLLTGEPDAPAVTSCHRNRERQRLTRRELQTTVTALALSLNRIGVREGDRVVAIARNSVEVVVAALATAAVGAIFSSCPEDMVHLQF